MYLAALPGSWLADNWLGQQRAVWYGSILIALGYLSIALSAWLGNDLFFIGLMLSSPGSGLFKPVSRWSAPCIKGRRAPRRWFSLFTWDQHRLVYRAGDLWLAYQIAWLALGLRHRGIGMLVALIIFRVFAVPSMKL